MKQPLPLMLRSIPTIAGIASQAADAGLIAESELLYRHAFARGESGPEIDRSIRLQTARLLGRGLRLSVTTLSRRSVEREVPARSSAEVIRFLRDELKSRLTLMDLFELMDVGPPIRLSGLLLEYSADEEFGRSIGISGRYDLRRLDLGWCRYECCFEFDEHGRPALLARAIRVSELIKGCGIGARSLLSLALFCARHAVPGWGERVQDDGIFAWRRLGGRLEPHGLLHAQGLLESLSESGAIARLPLERIDWSDPESIATIRVHPEQVRDEDALRRWFREQLRLCTTEIEALPRPYPLGYQALRASPLYAGYNTGEILRHLVRVYFPRRIADGGGAAMAAALEAAERERDLLKLSESALARHLASLRIRTRTKLRGALIAGCASGEAASGQPLNPARSVPAFSSWAPRLGMPLLTPAAALFPRLWTIRGR